MGACESVCDEYLSVCVCVFGGRGNGVLLEVKLKTI